MAGESTPSTPTPTAGDPPAGAVKPEVKPGESSTSSTSGDNEGAGSLRTVLSELADERKLRQQRETELADMKARHQSAEEKAIDAARKEGRSEVLAEVNGRVVRSEIRAAAAGKVEDPEDAVTLLGDLKRFIVKDEVDTKAISTAIEELVKAKPYLAPATGATKAKPLPGGGATPSSGTSINDAIRQQAGRA